MLAAGKAKLAICSAKYDCRVTLHLHRLLVFHQTMLYQEELLHLITANHMGWS